MTTYGTIPTSTAPSASSSSSPLDYISRAKERGRSALATRQPWRQFGDVRALSLPRSLGDSYIRIRTNAAYFAMNYAIVVLGVVFLSLLFKPVSLIVFIVCTVLWCFLYFLRDVPLVIYGREIGDRAVLVFLSIFTLVALLLTKATTNVLVSLMIGLVLVLIHAAIRRTEDLVLEGEAEGPGKWYTPLP
ncbi:PRA1 family protein F2-like [Curcuma longa]|uniref:PRA1 family protein F2-like n=1 Tax=Curcuma longa TaxID=136217 RepID=UPI003D9E5268